MPLGIAAPVGDRAAEVDPISSISSANEWASGSQVRDVALMRGWLLLAHRHDGAVVAGESTQPLGGPVVPDV